MQDDEILVWYARIFDGFKARVTFLKNLLQFLGVSNTVKQWNLWIADTIYTTIDVPFIRNY